MGLRARQRDRKSLAQGDRDSGMGGDCFASAMLRMATCWHRGKGGAIER